MNDISRVNIQTPSQKLIHEVLDMIVSQILTRVDYTMHICLHQIRNDINVFIAGLAGWFGYVDELDNVLMVEEF